MEGGGSDQAIKYIEFWSSASPKRGDSDTLDYERLSRSMAALLRGSWQNSS